MNSYWLSWHSDHYGKFELSWPWWVTGFDAEERPTICAAVRAPTVAAAQQIVIDSHDEPKPDKLFWRFVEERADDWTPYNDRFPRNEDWMPAWEAGAPPPDATTEGSSNV